MQKIHAAASIHLRFSHTGEYLLQNIRLEANIHKTLSKFHILAGRQSARDNSSGNNGQDVKAQGTIVHGTTGRTSKRKGQKFREQRQDVKAQGTIVQGTTGRTSKRKGQ